VLKYAQLVRNSVPGEWTRKNLLDLADGHAQQGKVKNAEVLLRVLVELCPGTGEARDADARLEALGALGPTHDVPSTEVSATESARSTQGEKGTGQTTTSRNAYPADLEEKASRRLKVAKALRDDARRNERICQRYRQRLREVIENYPGSEAAKEAKTLLADDE
jgi:hypothetical protein